MTNNFLRLLLILFLGALVSCAGGQRLVVEQPVVVGTDTIPQASSFTIGKKSTVTIQTGNNNTAATARTNNAGRSAESGANGGHSEAVTDNRVPLWAILLLVGVSAGGGALALATWQKRLQPGRVRAYPEGGLVSGPT